MAPVSKTDELNSLGSLILPSTAMIPREYTEEEKQLWADGAKEHLDPAGCRELPCGAVYEYTDWINDDMRWYPIWDSIWRDIGEKAFEIVEASL